MGRYVAGRFAGLVFALVLVSIITFLLMHAVPGGPFDELKQPLPPAAKANVLRKYGLDRPIWEQYALYMWRVLHLDFGIPFQSPTETVTELIARVWPATLQLAALTILLSYSLGILLGIVSALHQNSWIDYVVTTLATLGFAVPNFIIGIWLILVFRALRPLAGNRPECNKNVQTKVCEVAIAKAAAIEYLDFQVHTFGEAVAMPTIEVVQDAFAPIVERVDECL